MLSEDLGILKGCYRRILEFERMLLEDFGSLKGC